MSRFAEEGPGKGTGDHRYQAVAKHDRWHRFVVSRSLDSRGLYVYQVDNAANKESIAVPLELFERLRAAIKDVEAQLSLASDAEDHLVRDLRFGGRSQFMVTWRRTEPDQVRITSFGADEMPSAELVVAAGALSSLVSALYHPRLHHPNDLLVRIVTYHRLFAATFSGATESITSNLQLRRGLLTRVERYVPALGRKMPEKQDDKLVEPAMLKMLAPPGQKPSSQRSFRSRLGEREEARQYQVDYEELFAEGVSTPPQRARKGGARSADGDAAKTAAGGSVTHFTLPLLASEVKLFRKVPFRCELTRGDVKHLRKNFLDDRDASFFLGFEIIDCIFEERGKLKTFKFPLYYLPVRIVESGREAILHPLDGDRFYLNHFGLAQLVENYTSGLQAPKRLSELLSSLLSHQFTIQGAPDRVRVLRMLPTATEVFDRTREILLGLPGENGKGGLLSEVKVKAIECDLEQVELYKAPESSSPIVRALNDDLDQILRKAEGVAEGFDTSLLARTLSPRAAATEAKDGFSRVLSMRGAQARSIRNLVDRLNSHDLVLLEGPPGTGKTHNIANLLIHCVCTGQRVLVVSDQMAAVQALAEQIQAYVVGKNRDSPEGVELEQLWRMGIKVLEELPDEAGTLQRWSRQVRRMLGVDASKELDWPAGPADYERSLQKLDERMATITETIGAALGQRFGEVTSHSMPMVAPKSEHPSTANRVEAALSTAESLREADSVLGGIWRHIKHRERLMELGLQESYDLFSLEGRSDVAQRRLQDVHRWLGLVSQAAPVRVEEFDGVPFEDSVRALRSALRPRWLKAFPPDPGLAARAARFVRTLTGPHELHRLVAELREMVDDQLLMWSKKEALELKVWESLSRLHSALAPAGREPLDIPLELWMGFEGREDDGTSTQERLEELAKLQHERDSLVRRQFLYGLGQIGTKAFAAAKSGGTNRLTSILATLDRLESAASWARASDAVRELQGLLLEVFPVWVCRKQAVPFLLPCQERSFDLVIVDEATQCRVDDAIPLLFRAKKLMAVGDERQTVLAKNSAIDDYLFDDFELDEHLRFAQARGMKGGGSHLFGLVKRIKQASVMLDEHYRCPPDIIEFSNRYVYESQLRAMQWKMKGSPPSLVVDHSEAKEEPSGRDKSGKFKGVETDMIDRFYGFVARTVRRIERETGREVNPETDIALVYFLLKNEAYVKATKHELLKRLPRGTDILDGAGAALQGKERDYIFYLWDVTKYNIGVFRQGDDETKRKGELNVLMSRPKKRSYHYLHRDFNDLKHPSATITDFLWKARQRTTSKAKAKVRGSGPLIVGVLARVMGAEHFSDEDLQFGITLGNPNYGVDVMWLPPAGHRHEEPSIGIVDLAWFMGAKDVGQEVVDYYFQVRRSVPSVIPIFAFVHELARSGSPVVARLKAHGERR